VYQQQIRLGDCRLCSTLPDVFATGVYRLVSGVSRVQVLASNVIESMKTTHIGLITVYLVQPTVSGIIGWLVHWPTCRPPNYDINQLELKQLKAAPMAITISDCLYRTVSLLKRHWQWVMYSLQQYNICSILQTGYVHCAIMPHANTVYWSTTLVCCYPSDRLASCYIFLATYCAKFSLTHSAFESTLNSSIVSSCLLHYPLSFILVQASSSRPSYIWSVCFSVGSQASQRPLRRLLNLNWTVF